MDEQFLFGNVTVDDWYSYNKSNIHNELDVNPFFIFNGLSMKQKSFSRSFHQQTNEKQLTQKNATVLSSLKSGQT